MKRIKFNSNVVVDVIDNYNNLYDRKFDKNDIIEIEEVIPVSRNFSNIRLKTETLLDVKNIFYDFV